MSLLANATIDGKEEKIQEIKKKKKINELADIILYRRYQAKIDKKPAKFLDDPKNDKNNPDKCYIEEDYLTSYSLKYEIRQKKQRAVLIAKAKTLLGNPGKLTNLGTNDPKQYIYELAEDEQTGEVDKKKTVYAINYDLIAKQEKLDGYYCVCTNLVDDDNETILNTMRYRWFIEDSFRIMKQYFDFRPVWHYKDNRIKSHFTMCFLALLFYRYIQKICHESEYETLKRISDDDIFEILRSYNLTKIKGKCYIPSFDITDQIKDFEKLFNVSYQKRLQLQLLLAKK